MMKYKGYVGKVEYDHAAKILHGEVLGIRDVVTFQADIPEKVERAFRESVDDYLAFCKERGEEPNAPASGRFVVRVDADLHRKLSILAAASGKSLNTLVEEYLRREADEEMPANEPKRHRGMLRKRAG